jgi:hypothetical protein
MSTTKYNDAEVYSVRKDYEWATIVLRCWSRPANVGTPHERTYYCGEIIINSTFGCWANVWTACGEPFKQFLLDAEFDYVFTKFMGAKLEVWDGEGSVKSLRRLLLEYRRIGDLDKEEARKLWDEIDANEYELESSSNDFVECASRIADDIDSRGVHRLLSEPWELTTTQHDHQAVGFWRELWPEFTQALRAEVAAESQPLAA